MKRLLLVLTFGCSSEAPVAPQASTSPAAKAQQKAVAPRVEARKAKPPVAKGRTAPAPQDDALGRPSRFVAFRKHRSLPVADVAPALRPLLGEAKRAKVLAFERGLHVRRAVAAPGVERLTVEWLIESRRDAALRALKAGLIAAGLLGADTPLKDKAFEGPAGRVEWSITERVASPTRLSVTLERKAPDGAAMVAVADLGAAFQAVLTPSKAQVVGSHFARLRQFAPTAGFDELTRLTLVLESPAAAAAFRALALEHGFVADGPQILRRAESHERLSLSGTTVHYLRQWRGDAPSPTP